MTPKILSFLLLLCLCFTNISAQDYNHYQPLQLSGDIPDDFLKAASEKFFDQSDSLVTTTDKREKKTREDFLLMSNFNITDLLLSGKIIFNDPISEYLTNIKDYLLHDNPELKDRIRIYLVRSPAVNAFATNDGIILVNMGLIAQIQNEAQLAFVLCHEIQHYIKQHPINNYVESRDISESNPMFRGASAQELMFAKNRFSRELETEADVEGYNLYKSSNYSFKAIDGLYDVLQYSYLPIDEVPFELSYFETANLVFPKSFKLDTINPIKTKEDYDSLKSTHPSITSRRATLKALYKGENDADRTKSIFGEDRFSEVRKMARYELSHLYLQVRAYEMAIYNSWLLLRKNPKSYYLKKCIAQALYGLSRYKNETEYFSVHTEPGEIEGESQQVYELFDKISKPGLNALAVSYCWDVYKSDKEDPEMKAIISDLMEDMWRNNETYSSEMSHEKKPVVIADVKNDAKPVNADSLNEEDDKYSKIKNLPSATKAKEEGDVFKYAFVDLFKDDEFSTLWDESKGRGSKKESSSSEIAKSRKKQRLKGVNLNLDKIAVVDPILMQVDTRKKIQVQYIAGEQAKDEYKQIMKETAATSGLNMELLDPREAGISEADYMNDIFVLKQWIGDYFFEKDVATVNLYRNEVLPLIEKYGTSASALNGVFLLKSKHVVTAYEIGAGCLYILPLFFTLAKVLTADNTALYFNFVFDLDKEVRLMSEAYEIKVKANKTLLKSSLYNSWIQVKGKKK